MLLGNPENYVHIALHEIRRADIIWEKEEVQIYEKLKLQAEQNQSKIPEYVKNVLKKLVDRRLLCVTKSLNTKLTLSEHRLNQAKRIILMRNNP